MKRLIYHTIFCLTPFFAFSQKVRVEFILIDSTHPTHTEFFLASNQNSWNPGDSLYKFKKEEDGTNRLVTYFDKGTLVEFKFTRGSWETVECFLDGKDQDNKELKTNTDGKQIYIIKAWKDQFKTVAKQHTASSRVRIMDTAFFIPQLNRKRRIWIYLPKDYENSKARYPVLYMQDGQNLFD